MLKIKNHEFNRIKNLIHSKVGINLSTQKRSLVVGRLQKELMKNGFSSFEEYYNAVITDKTGIALVTLVDRISTNHTYFYREPDHFSFFSNTVLPDIRDNHAESAMKKLRIWSAGCSSGEEPYTLAMMISEFLHSSPDAWDVGILATDISVSAIKNAEAGVYSAENVGLLPETLQQKYFVNRSTNRFMVNDTIKKMVLFKRLNLIREQFPFRGKFQAIFCRNVMIYFDAETRSNLVSKFSQYLEPQGFLFIGHSESLGRNNDYFEYVQPAVYRKKK